MYVSVAFLWWWCMSWVFEIKYKNLEIIRVKVWLSNWKLRNIPRLNFWRWRRNFDANIAVGVWEFSSSSCLFRWRSSQLTRTHMKYRYGARRLNRWWSRGSSGWLSGNFPAFWGLMRRKRPVLRTHISAKMAAPPSSSPAQFAWRRWFRISSKKATRSNCLRLDVAGIAAIASTGIVRTARRMNSTFTVAVSVILLSHHRAKHAKFWRFGYRSTDSVFALRFSYMFWKMFPFSNRVLFLVLVFVKEICWRTLRRLLKRTRSASVKMTFAESSSPTAY